MDGLVHLINHKRSALSWQTSEQFGGPTWKFSATMHGCQVVQYSSVSMYDAAHPCIAGLPDREVVRCAL